jgi:GPH family glycoside/pentoside/hexuronide:cation symporter
MSVILAIVSIPPVYLVFAATRERPEYQDLPTPSIRESFRMAGSNRAFLIAAGLYLLTWIPIDLIQYVLVFLIRDCFRLGSADRDIIFFLLFGVATVALPFWVRVSAHWDKKRAYQIGIASLAVVLCALSFTPSTRKSLAFVLAALGGIGVSAAHALPLAILPDVVEWDELRSGNRYEAAYYSVLALIHKVVGAAVVALTGSVLAYTGYVTTGGASITQPASALKAIRVLSGPLPAIFLFLGIVLAFFYPISRERHARILRALEKKRRLRGLVGEGASGVVGKAS